MTLYHPNDGDERRGLGLIFLFVAVATLLGCLVMNCRKAHAQPAPDPLGVPVTAEMIALGRALFNDPILSEDGTISCASCHQESRGFADGLPVAIGIRGRAGTMNAPTILNAAYFNEQFWNGRALGTATQALLPLENDSEMGGRGNEAAAVRRLSASEKYVRLFAEAYGSAPTAATLGLSIAAFETTIVSTDVLANRRARGELVLTPDAELGYQLFVGRAGCIKCHNGPLWTDKDYHNVGVDHGRTTGDQGRVEVTRNRADRRKWKTPSLIGIRKTAPYMHDGSLPTLRSVLVHFNTGGARNGQVDARTEIRALGLSDSQLDYLEAFCREGFEPLSWPK